jgi:hypothetical protein
MRVTLLALALMMGPAQAATDPEPSWVTQARQAAGELGSELKGTLMQALQAGGPVEAIDVCRLRAPEIAESVSTGPVRVGRTALKVRNPDNAPDDWERGVMRRFSEAIDAGQDAGSLEAFAIHRQDGRRQGRWMKAIPMGGPCAACHGVNLPSEVLEAIDAAYPEDEARGFDVGSLRGAFTVEIDLESD